MKSKSTSGYSSIRYEMNFTPNGEDTIDTALYLAAAGIQAKKKWDEKTKKVTDEVTQTVVQLYMPNEDYGFIEVRLPAEFNKQIDDLAKVRLINPEAYEDNYRNLLVRADDLEVLYD